MDSNFREGGGGGGERSHEIKVNLYDLSRGLASGLSQNMLGVQLDGIWHTGVVVYGFEYFFGGGIHCLTPAQVIQRYGMVPNQTISLGETLISRDNFHSFLRSPEMERKFNVNSYHLLRNNCNNFSDDVVKFLRGDDKGIPAHITELPNRVMSTPVGRMFLEPMLTNLERSNPFNVEDGHQLEFTETDNSLSWREIREVSLASLMKKHGEELVYFFEEKPTAGFSQSIDCVVDDFLYIGSLERVDQWACSRMKGKKGDPPIGITHVLNLSANESASTESSNWLSSSGEVEYFGVDSLTSQPEDVFDVVTSFIEASLENERKSRCLVFCSQGINESAAAVCSYLLQSDTSQFNIPEIDKEKSLKSVLLFVKSKRKCIYPDLQYLDALISVENEVLGQTSLTRQAVSELHFDSSTSELRKIVTDPVEDIMALGLPGVNETAIEQALDKTKGDINAAINLLL
mmetsp:Transcript_17859/g.21819  ORF Transcript_17859/g.21819 Transcript_17859/m.21819 type:complete len:459 (-) Transcript_17859:959-2335(-)